MKAVVAILLLAGCGVAIAAAAFLRRPSAPAPVLDGFSEVERDRILLHSPLGPPPPDPTNAVADNPQAARLGQRIFFDKRFSRDGAFACATCHTPASGFGDGKPMPPRFPVDRNVPTLWNVAYQRWYFWDGRADSLWAQALQPMENPREHGTTRLQVIHALRGDVALKGDYEKIFGAFPDCSDAARFPAAGGPVVEEAGGPLGRAWASMSEADRGCVDRVYANVGKAIAAYERKLVSRRSPFDVYVEGLRTGDAAKLGAISSAAKEGLRLFVGRGNCRLCHSGPNFSDGEFHNLGIAPLRGGPSPFRFAAIQELKKNPFNGKSAFSDDREAGARKIDFLTELPETWGQVRTPGLRNVAKTGPYMHQGQFGSLREVIRFYSTLDGMLQAGHHERTILLPLRLSAQESAALVAFLESLTDEAVDPSLLQSPKP